MSDDRRTNFRCNSPDDNQFAVIRRKGRDLKVRLVDQSAEGYAVAARSIRTKEGQRFLLRTNRGWSEVEVARITRSKKETTLGLKEIRELPDPREPVARNSLIWSSGRSSAGSATRLGPMVTLGLVAVLAFWVYVAYAVYRITS